MAKPSKMPGGEDPRITDLRAYRKAREAEKRRKPPNPKAQMRETILGANPRAGAILVLLGIGLLAYFFLPTIIALIRR
jgi:hypothetical protein